jgi:hypothetical protein
MEVNDGSAAFAAIALLLILTMSLVTTVQARAQGNRYWWAWALLATALPFAGYGLWRLIGARDDGSPDDLLR